MPYRLTPVTHLPSLRRRKREKVKGEKAVAVKGKLKSVATMNSR